MAWVITAIVLALLLIIAIVILAGAVSRGARRHRAGDWGGQALDACAAADALHDRFETKLTLVQAGGREGGAAAERWSDTERSMDQLAVKLHALRSGAPDYTSDQATEELIMALAALRSAMQVEHGARAISSSPAGDPVTTVHARLMDFHAAVRALRAAV